MKKTNIGKKLAATLLATMLSISTLSAPVLAEAPAQVSENTAEAGTVTDTTSVELVYLEDSFVSLPGQVRIAVVLTSDAAVTDAFLTVVDQATGNTRKIAETAAVEDTHLFTEDFAPGEEGIYAVRTLTLSLEKNGESLERMIDLGEAGFEAVTFGVGASPLAEAGDEVVTEEDLSQLSDQVVSLGVDGDALLSASATGNEIADALANGDEDLIRLTPEQDLDAESNVVVFLDAGHDGTHRGARGNGLAEESLTLRTMQYCYEELSGYRGVTVYVSRNSSSCPYPGTTSTACNANRVNAAAAVGASYFVSIHFNSATSATPRGAEVFYPNSNYNAGIGSTGAGLSQQILRQLTALGLASHGISIRNSQDKTTYPDGSLADYYGVIRRSKLAGITGIIIEHAYVSNPNDAAFLSNETNLQKLGIADATGIANYLGLKKREPADRNKVTAFVTRLYEKCLGRTPDANGLKYWVDKLCDFEIDGNGAAFGFVFSDEFTNKKLSDEDYVETLYQVFLDRSSDATGKAYWVKCLDQGCSRYGVYMGFVESAEFTRICDETGIDRGDPVAQEGRDYNRGVTGFVSRLYTKALSRDYELDGLNYWCDEIHKGNYTVDTAATVGFFESREFTNRNLSDEAFVKVLYQTFMDRDYDATGLKYWTDKLKAGEKRSTVIDGFSKSQEFSNIKASYGL